MGQDDSALQEFIHGRRDHLFRSAFLLCGDRDEADDLVQTALLKVILAWRRLERIDSVEAFARRTLVNVFIASRRRMWRREQPHGELPEHAAPTVDMEAALAVQAALARLPVKQRAVLVLRFWEDLSVEATADVLGMRPGTVRSHASRGIAALRAYVPRGIGLLEREEA
ncbi:SigE family RNA polymerase sigma factor [Streptacidiphilus jiangxiensis]|uniref:RNA polymerase sigma-70 factor, sigma-E family n=1 Tax=Streptacidiphilus jiangxiensis TaxID=235985 RepID=A0A1H7N185_STRJI|nr:SigE family RNA polymerase sigma factor [Streptacidiphilus jiangxiensis]SEL17079.1 RNA polymerase sigma-70 factor, sigma-E family [Streptacidiphilus jiangxiensis]